MSEQEKELTPPLPQWQVSPDGKRESISYDALKRLLDEVDAYIKAGGQIEAVMLDPRAKVILTRIWQAQDMCVAWAYRNLANRVAEGNPTLLAVLATHGISIPVFIAALGEDGVSASELASRSSRHHFPIAELLEALPHDNAPESR